jgi:hypothetical protein
MVNRGVTAAFFGGTSRGGKGCESERTERGAECRHARNVERRGIRSFSRSVL